MINKTTDIQRNIQNKIDKSPKGRFLKLLFRYYKIFPKLFFAMVIFVTLNVITTVIQPKLLHNLLKSVVEQEKVYGLKWWIWVFIMFAVLFLTILFTFLSGLFGGKIAKKIEIELRKDVLNNLIKQDMSFYSKSKSGETLTKVIQDTGIIGDKSKTIPSTIISVFLTLIGASLVLFFIDWTLTLISLLFVLIILLIVMLSFKTITKRMLKARKEITEVNGQITDKLNSISLIKSFGSEEKEKETFQKIHKEYYKASKKVVKSSTAIATLITAGISSLSIVVISFAALFYQNKPIKLITILPSFLSGVSLMAFPIIRISILVSGLAQGSASSSRIDSLLNLKTKVDVLDKENKTYIKKLKGNIKFEKVVFSYPEKPGMNILPETSFTFEEGKSYAFVGKTGSGKSTISKLLLRFYDPQDGKITINDGLNLKEVYLPSYLKHVGYVEQEPVILYGTIKDNIKYSFENASDKQVINAAKKAKLHKIIMSWPKKYDSIIGERGVLLSGGQKQRLVLARMFLKNPFLLILDEATSSLDNIVESEINEELKALSKGRTTIIIAHRLSTIKDVDEIIVIKRNGGIVETGNFKELKEKNGYFQELYKAGLVT